MDVKSPNAPMSMLFGIPVAALTMEQALDLIHDTIRHRRRLQIGVVNAAKIVNMRRDRFLRAAVLSSDIIFADGSSVVWAARLLRRRLPERIAGIDLMMAILDRANRYGYRIYCLGAREDVSRRVADRIEREYPNVILAGRHHGYFSEDEAHGVADMIAASKPDIIFVAITSPKKEKFMARWSDRIGVPVCHGVGGSFDVFAGKVRRAPAAWQRLGLEWLYRLKQEPMRLLKRYLITNSVFVYMVFKEVVSVMPKKEHPASAKGLGRKVIS